MLFTDSNTLSTYYINEQSGISFEELNSEIYIDDLKEEVISYYKVLLVNKEGVILYNGVDDLYITALSGLRLVMNIYHKKIYKLFKLLIEYKDSINKIFKDIYSKFVSVDCYVIVINEDLEAIIRLISI